MVMLNARGFAREGPTTVYTIPAVNKIRHQTRLLVILCLTTVFTPKAHYGFDEPVIKL
jgi:hypothetical protein